MSFFLAFHHYDNKSRRFHETVLSACFTSIWNLPKNKIIKIKLQLVATLSVSGSKGFSRPKMLSH